MNFGEKVKKLRKEKKMSQTDLAKQIGVSMRTVQSYEAGMSYPKNRNVYTLLAQALSCDENYLRTENEDFITDAAAAYGKRGEQQARSLLDATAAMFAGGELSEDDKLAFIHEINSLYFDSKERAKKFTPRKYRNETDGSTD